VRLHGCSSGCLFIIQNASEFDAILSALYIAFVIREPNMVLDASHFWRFL
jgi:hypothetical protein